MDKLMTYKEEELIAYVDEINYGFKAKIVKGLESFENDYEKVFLIKKVDPKHVKAVYFGHRVKESEVERIKALISDKNHPLNKINIIHLCIDKKEFILKKRDD